MAVTWGADTALTTQTAINNSTEEFVGTIDLSSGLLAHIQLEVDNEHATTVTDDLIVSVYSTLDDASEVFDDEPFMQFQHTPATVSLERVAFDVSGVYKFRIGCLSSGATDTYTAGGDYRVRTA
jgi:hypothetical protein